MGDAASDRVPLEHALTSREELLIDVHCARGDWAAALTRLGVEVTVDPDVVVGFARDESNLPGAAAALARPATVRECAAVLRACSRAGVPVTVSGGRTNLTGSATPEAGLVLSMVRMLTPPSFVDEADRTVTAPVGMLLENLRNEVLRQTDRRLEYPVNPTSRGECTVGGTIACNASGFVPGERGATRQWVESVELLLPTGELIRATRGEYVSRDGVFVLEDGARSIEVPVPRYERPRIKNAGGPYSAPDGRMDLVDWIVGSEGIFGLVTSCTLRLAPAPRTTLDLFVPLAGEEEAVTLLDFLRQELGGDLGSLGALEYFGAGCRGLMDHEEALFQGGSRVALYIQCPLEDEEPEDAAAVWLDRIARSGCGATEDSILLLDNPRDRTLYFEARHSLPARTLEVVQRRGTFMVMTDAAVPSQAFREYLRFAHSLLAEAGMEYNVFGHMGDCHLHFTLLPEAGSVELAVRLYERIVDRAAALGGVYSGEHGTGKRKRGDFLRCYGPSGAKEVLRCKRAVDPGLFLNRGDVVAV